MKAYAIILVLSFWTHLSASPLKIVEFPAGWGSMVVLPNRIFTSPKTHEMVVKELARIKGEIPASERTMSQSYHFLHEIYHVHQINEMGVLYYWNYLIHLHKPRSKRKIEVEANEFATRWFAKPIRKKRKAIFKLNVNIE